MAEKKNPLGPTGETLIANLKHLREERGLTYQKLSDALADIGRPIPTLGLSRIEKGARRVDVDDLVALAMALEISPVTLLLPAEKSGEVALTEETSAPWHRAWRWMHGEQPLPSSAGGDSWSSRAEWARRNRPYVKAPILEIERTLETHETYGPFRLEAEHDGDKWVQEPTLTRWSTRPEERS